MTDEEFIRALEDCSLPEGDFHHAAHVRAAYLLLRQADFAAALQRIRHAIRRYVAHLGQAGRYHETITVASAALIHQHVAERGDGGGWLGFARENPELLSPDLLRHHYAPAELDSALARAVFVLPQPDADRVGLHLASER
jgi:hypothetical protein